VKAARSAGGAIILIALALFAWIGISSPTGQGVLDPLWQSVQNLFAGVRSVGDDALGSLGGTGAAGNGLLCILLGLVAFLAAYALVPGLRAGWGLAFLAAGSTVLGLALYSPGLVS